MRLLIIATILTIFAFVANAQPVREETAIENNDFSSTGNTAEYDTPVTPKSHLEARKDEDEDDHDITCDLKRDNGNKDALGDAIKWLREERTKEGKPKLKGNTCQTAVCAKGTKIKWCNDVCRPNLNIPTLFTYVRALLKIMQNKDTKTLPSWINVAEGATVIGELCKKKDDGVLGSLDHTDNWRVIVYAEDCYMQPGPDEPGSDKD